MVFMLIAAMNFATHFGVAKRRALHLQARSGSGVAPGVDRIELRGRQHLRWVHNVYPDFATAFRS